MRPSTDATCISWILFLVSLQSSLSPVLMRQKAAFKDSNLEYARETVGEYLGNRWLVGAFPMCVTEELENSSFAFVSLDCDLHDPIAAGLEFFFPRLSPGGMIFVHDYSSGHWPGAKTAVDEFVRKVGVVGVLLPDKSGTNALAQPAISD